MSGNTCLGAHQLTKLGVKLREKKKKVSFSWWVPTPEGLSLILDTPGLADYHLRGLRRVFVVDPGHIAREKGRRGTSSSMHLSQRKGEMG